MKFLVDAQLPPALSRMLISEGHESSHVYELGMADVDDRAVWSYALQNNAVLITKDEDFAHRSWRTTEKVPVIWIRLGNCANKLLIANLTSLLPTIIKQLEAGETLIEIR